MRFGYFDGFMALFMTGVFYMSSVNVERQVVLRRKLRAEEARMQLLDRMDTAQIWIGAFTMVVALSTAVFCAIRFAWSMG